MGVFCKSLRFLSLRNEKPLNSMEFTQLLSYMPNVKHIQLWQHQYTLYYLDLLMTYPHLLPNIQEIEKHHKIYDSEEDQLYDDCLFTFKSTIRKMSLVSLDKIIHTTDGRSGYILSFLQESKALRDLEIINARPRGGAFQLKIFTVIRSCPALKRFSVSNAFVEDDQCEGSFDYSQLEYLRIHAPKVTRRQIDYVVSNISNLKMFELDCGGSCDVSQTPMEWVEEIGPECMKNFCIYLAKIDCVSLSVGGMEAQMKCLREKKELVLEKNPEKL